MLSKLFLNERFILSIIVLNALVIFLQGFDLEETQYLYWIDQGITIFFVVELIVKLKILGFRTYFKDNWNIFDFVLILIAIPSLVFLLVPSSFISLDFLLIFRILRVFKFFRFIRFIPNIDSLVNGAFRAARASILIIICFVILNFIVSLLSCFMFRNLSPEYFGDPLIAFYSIFKIFTIEGWYEIPDSIAENSDSVLLTFFVRLYFVIVLFGGGIFGLSLVNSIFVDSMISENQDDVEKRLHSIEEKIDRIIESNKLK